VAKTEVNVSAVIDAGSLNRYQIGVFFLCGLFLIMDGFDVQSMGYVAPAIITDWKIPRETITPVLMSGLFGLFIGSMLFGMLGDRIGRRRVLLGATIAFSAFTLLSARATSLTELGIIRFFAGFGLGAVLPNATALIGEFSPSRMRIATMMIVTNGFTVGAALGGFLAAWLIPEYGWRSVWYVGGLVPIVWVLATVLLWRETAAERLARMSKLASHPTMLCPFCGYNLSGLREARCPECGASFTLDELAASQPQRDEHPAEL